MKGWKLNWITLEDLLGLTITLFGLAGILICLVAAIVVGVVLPLQWLGVL